MGDANVGESIDVASALGSGSSSCGKLTLSTNAGSIQIDAAVTDPNCDVQLNTGATYQDDTEIVQGAAGSISAATLGTADNGTGPGTLNNPASEVVSLIAQDSNASSLTFDDADALDLEGGEVAGPVTISAAGDINLKAFLNSTGHDMSLVSTGGSVAELDNAAVSAGDLTVRGDAVSLPANNDNMVTDTLSATATAGDVNAYLYDTTTRLGDVQASGSVTVMNGDGSLQPTGTISGQSIDLTAQGITAVSGNTALLSAPSVAITDKDASDPWTVTPGTVAAQGTGTIAYSGTSSLSVSGGASFNVTPSTATTVTLDGASPTLATPLATLIYNAQGRTVSGTTSAPSGTIDATGVEPVKFTGMSSVTINGAASAATSVGSGNTGTTSNSGSTATDSFGASTNSSGNGGTSNRDGTSSSSATNSATPTITAAKTPTCTLRATSSKVALPKRIHGKLKGVPTLTFVATCTDAISTVLKGSIIVASKPAHGKTKSIHYTVKSVRSTPAANTPTKIILDLPRSVISALAKKTNKLSAITTLADSDDAGLVLTTVDLKSLI